MAKRVLFVCVHNSARSQIAEALFNKYCKSDCEAYSAGLEPGELNPYVVQVLKEDEGIDISKNRTKSAMEFIKNGTLFSYVVTVCDEATSQRCPIFPGVRERIIMSFKDPSELKGSDEEILEQVREIKDAIKQDIIKFTEFVKSDELEEEIPKNWKIG